ncbi:MAG: hypothetical protein HY900_32955 [Deltaproteobacteria bacterium]|nr:hypothetical protein [Deltaproteobacteria bacterium]
MTGAITALKAPLSGGLSGVAAGALRRGLGLGLALLLVATLAAAGEPAAQSGKICLSVRNTEIAEVFEMLSRAHRVNFLVTKDVVGPISVNLYDVELDAAVRSIAEAGGYAVERRDNAYVVLKREEAGKDSISSLTRTRSFRVQYSNVEAVAGIVRKHLSRYGQVTVLPDRGLLVVQDLPEFLARVDGLLAEVDLEPKQILIEAKALEITLEEGETFGIDWVKLFRAEGGEGSFGTQGLARPDSQGLFFEFANRNLDVQLHLLAIKDRVRTLSTPKLLALENQEAQVIVGDRLGYKVTTTVNQVTTESIQFLESGVILRVRPSVDRSGRILLEVTPEVSSGSVSAGIPSKRTTAVTTKLLAEDGQTIFIGGLIKNRTAQNRSGVPLLGSLPLLGRLFTATEDVSTKTETVVLITPRIVDERLRASFARETERAEQVELELQVRPAGVDRALE